MGTSTTADTKLTVTMTALGEISRLSELASPSPTADSDWHRRHNRAIKASVLMVYLRALGFHTHVSATDAVVKQAAAELGIPEPSSQTRDLVRELLLKAAPKSAPTVPAPGVLDGFKYQVVELKYGETCVGIRSAELGRWTLREDRVRTYRDDEVEVVGILRSGGSSRQQALEQFADAHMSAVKLHGSITEWASRTDQAGDDVDDRTVKAITTIAAAMSILDDNFTSKSI